MAGIARFSVVCLDTRDPSRLARFYSELTGLPIDHDGGDWIQLRSESGAAALAFQLAPDHQAPQWPDADHPQQAHLDFDVPDLDAAEAAVLALGAVKATYQPGTTFRVYLDPAGHPFCLVRE